MIFKIPWSLNFLNSLCGYEDVGLGTQFPGGMVSGITSVSRCLNVGQIQ